MIAFIQTAAYIFGLWLAVVAMCIPAGIAFGKFMVWTKTPKAPKA